MTKIKMKSKKAITKRFKVTGTGKLIRSQAGTSHLAHGKTTKAKRQLQKSTETHSTDAKRMKKLMHN